MDKILFQETQKFNQWWLWLILLGILGSVVWSLLAFKSDVPSIVTVVSIGIALIIFLMFLMLKLKTTITEEKITIHYFPFVKREWQWNELNTAEVIDYGFVGGWGIRIWTGYGTVYNVKGSKGLHIKTDHKEHVIGTQKEEELRSSIAHLLK